MDNIINLLKGISRDNQILLLGFDDWSQGGTAKDYSSFSCDQTYENNTDSSKGVGREVGFNFTDMTGDGVIMNLNSNVYSRIDQNSGTYICRINLAAAEWADSNRYAFIDIESDGFFDLQVRKDSDPDQIRVSMRTSPAGDTKALSVSYSKDDEFAWFALTWDTVADELKVYADGVELINRTTDDTNTDTITECQLFSALNLRRVKGSVQFACLWDVALTPEEIALIARWR